MLYLLTLTGVYDQGPLGLFDDLETAETYARELYEASDGYHGFRLEEIEINQRIEQKGGLTTLNVGAVLDWRNKAPFEKMFERVLKGG